MSSPTRLSRHYHQLACSAISRSNPSEVGWSAVLHDTQWFTEDPASCCRCSNHATHKVGQKGFCPAHHAEAVRAATSDANAMIARYTRAARMGQLSFGLSLVSKYLPKVALAEAVQA